MQIRVNQLNRQHGELVMHFHSCKLALLLFSVFAFSRGSVGLALPAPVWFANGFIVIALLILALRRQKKALLNYVTVFLVYILLILWGWRNQDLAHGVFAEAFYMSIIFLFGIVMQRYRDWHRMLFHILAYVGCFYSIWTIVCAIQPAVYFDFILPWLRRYEPMTGRGNYTCGFTTHYSINGMYISIGLMGTLARLLCADRNDREAFSGIKVCLVIQLIGLLLCGKRGIAICVLLAFCAAYLFSARSHGRLFKLVGVLVVLVAAFYIASFWFEPLMVIIDRFVVQIEAGDISTGRFDIWEEAWAAFLEAPVFGNGWGWFRYNNTFGTSFHAHNCYLQWLCELGILFSVPVFVAIFFFYFRSYKGIRKLAMLNPGSVKTTTKSLAVFSFMYQTFFLGFMLEGTGFYEVQTLFMYVLCIAMDRFIGKEVQGQV